MNIKLLLQRAIYSEGMVPLKHGVVFALTFLFFVDAMTMTTVFSYLPKLVKSFGASEVQTGKDAGLIAASLFISRIFSSLLWGYFADVLGKKKVLLISSTGIAISTFAFGFSCSFTWALITRLLQGALMGVIVITKSILTDICDDTNVALAFTILFTGYQVGLIIGPSLSAVLVFPVERYPHTFVQDSFFNKYPIFLPNLLITFGFVLANAWIFWVVPQDNSLFKPEKICLINEETPVYSDFTDKQDHYLKLSLNDKEQHHVMSENSPLLKNSKNVASLFSKLIHAFKYSSAGRILRSKESFACIMLYGFYGIVGIGFPEIEPIFLATAKEYGGTAMTVFDIGILVLIYSTILLFTQLGTSKLLYWLGAKKSFMGCIVFFACTVPLLPLSALVTNSVLRWIFLVVIQVPICTASNVCFIAINVFLGNSVEPELVGTINGLGMSVSSIGRTLGPSILGIAYSWSLSNIERHRLGFPFNQYFVFFVLSICCFLNFAYVYWLIPSTLDKRKDYSTKKEIVITLHEYIHY